MSSKPIALWSGPRNVSTALMYSFANRGDVKVYDEPFFGYFLKHTGVWRPSRDEVLAQMEPDFDKVLEGVLKESKSKRLFLKNMANHLEGQEMASLKHYDNVILTRKPDSVIASFTRQIEQPTALDLCYAHQLQIIEYLEQEGIPYLIVDSDDLRKSPVLELKRLSEFADLPFTDNMLRWPAGARPEDGVWAKYWYHNVHKSIGFMPFEDKQYAIPEHLQPLYETVYSQYQQIKAHQV